MNNDAFEKMMARERVYSATRLANAYKSAEEPPHPAMPNKPLKGQFRDYLTDIDVTYEAERLDPDYQAHLDSLKPWWEQQDGDHEWIEKKDLF